MALQKLDSLVFIGCPTAINGTIKNVIFCLRSGRIMQENCYNFCGNKIYLTEDLDRRTSVYENNVVLYQGLYREIVGSGYERLQVCKVFSKDNHCTLAFCGAGINESSSNFIYSGDMILFEKGQLKLYVPTLSGKQLCRDESFPYVSKENLDDVFKLQVLGLTTRLQLVNCKKVTIGVSGGSDSALALAVICQAFTNLNLDLKDIHAFVLKGLGSSDRTNLNAIELIKNLGVSYHFIDISTSVLQHFKDIEFDGGENVVYENAQARERTQILLDYANLIDGIMVGTGDMSEIALGYCTYGGDHFSMYNCNGGVPKTTVLALLNYFADIVENKNLSLIYRDIAVTPISAELKKNQLTEEAVGSYQLIDFIMYNYFEKGLQRDEIRKKAEVLLPFSAEYIGTYFVKFFKRFFANQFKRNCSPDSVQIFPLYFGKESFSLPSEVKYFE